MIIGMVLQMLQQHPMDIQTFQQQQHLLQVMQQQQQQQQALQNHQRSLGLHESQVSSKRQISSCSEGI